MCITWKEQTSPSVGLPMSHFCFFCLHLITTMIKTNKRLNRHVWTEKLFFNILCQKHSAILIVFIFVLKSTLKRRGVLESNPDTTISIGPIEVNDALVISDLDPDGSFGAREELIEFIEAEIDHRIKIERKNLKRKINKNNKDIIRSLKMLYWEITPFLYSQIWKQGIYALEAKQDKI